MGIFEPMAINTAMATGLLEPGGWTAVWWLLVGVLGGALGGIVASARHASGPREGARRALPTLAEHSA